MRATTIHAPRDIRLSDVAGPTINVPTGAFEPDLVVDLTLPLDEVAEGYRALDERRAITVMLQP